MDKAPPNHLNRNLSVFAFTMSEYLHGVSRSFNQYTKMNRVKKKKYTTSNNVVLSVILKLNIPSESTRWSIFSLILNKSCTYQKKCPIGSIFKKPTAP